uniref:Uncharacterized protein n=1 Tax=Anguilla anguilla TaxID=7936 RepID=A0A0E9T9B8_ANGAN
MYRLYYYYKVDLNDKIINLK